MSRSEPMQTAPVRWHDPFIGWRLMTLGDCPTHGCAALVWAAFFALQRKSLGIWW